MEKQFHLKLQFNFRTIHYLKIASVREITLLKNLKLLFWNCCKIKWNIFLFFYDILFGSNYCTL